MNGEQAERFQQLLEEACDHHIDGGGKVITRFFKDSEGGRCPLACLFGLMDIRSIMNELKQMLGVTVSYEEIWTLIYAFDGVGLLDYQKQYVSMLLIAGELRKKYIGAPV